MANISAYSYKSWETSFGNGMAAGLKSELDHYEKLLYRLLYHTAQKEQTSFLLISKENSSTKEKRIQTVAFLRQEDRIYVK